VQAIVTVELVIQYDASPYISDILCIPSMVSGI